MSSSFFIVTKVEKKAWTRGISLSKKIIDTGKIRQITVAQMLAETLRRIDNKESVSSLFIE